METRFPQPGQGSKEVKDRYIEELKQIVSKLKKRQIEYGEGEVGQLSKIGQEGYMVITMHNFNAEKWHPRVPFQHIMNMVNDDGIKPGTKVKIILEIEEVDERDDQA